MSTQTATDNSTAPATDWLLTAKTAALGDLQIPIYDNHDATKIGRSNDNDVVLASPSVSRSHAQISVQNGNLFIKDLGSSNGTFVNGKALEANKSKHISVGDSVLFAEFEFAVTKATDVHNSSKNGVTAIAESDAPTAHAQDPVTISQPDAKEPLPTNHKTLSDTNAELNAPTDSPAKPIEPSESNEPTDSADAEPQHHFTSLAGKTDEPSTAAAAQADTADSQSVNANTNISAKAAPQAQTEVKQQSDLAKQADEAVLEAKQAATGQLSGTTNTEPANAAGQSNRNSGSWFIWVFLFILIIAAAVWLSNMG